eukprot:3595836-Pyramimonas_sp.AAC.2
MIRSLINSLSPPKNGTVTNYGKSDRCLRPKFCQCENRRVGKTNGRSMFQLSDNEGSIRRRQSHTRSSKRGWGWNLFEAIPDDAMLRNEEVNTVAEAIAVGVRLYNENRRTVAVEYFDRALKMEPTSRCREVPAFGASRERA